MNKQSKTVSFKLVTLGSKIFMIQQEFIIVLSIQNNLLQKKNDVTSINKLKQHEVVIRFLKFSGVNIELILGMIQLVSLVYSWCRKRIYIMHAYVMHA